MPVATLRFPESHLCLEPRWSPWAAAWARPKHQEGADCESSSADRTRSRSRGQAGEGISQGGGRDVRRAGLEAALQERVRERAEARAEAGKKYFAAHPWRSAEGSQAQRQGEPSTWPPRWLLTLPKLGGSLELPTGGGPLTFLDYKVSTPVQAAPTRRSETTTRTRASDGVDLLGLMPDDRLGGRGPQVSSCRRRREVERGTRRFARCSKDSPANAAIVDANREALQKEDVGSKAERTHVRRSAGPHSCSGARATGNSAESERRRRARAGFESSSGSDGRSRKRLASSCSFYLSISTAIRLDLRENGPEVQGGPELIPAWELGAGKLKPKPKPKPKSSGEDEFVEADMSRDVRQYKITETYTPGDRIQHPTLGVGIVQRGLGPGKMKVSFDDKISLLVHERPAPS